ncbi:MAG: hypothetical protein V3T88_02445, partial [Nitrosomonadaceae bacterium]
MVSDLMIKLSNAEAMLYQAKTEKASCEVAYNNLIAVSEGLHQKKDIQFDEIESMHTKLDSV